MRILASLRSADLADLAGEIQALEDAGIDGLHLDAMDGHLVDDLSLGPAHVRSVRAVTELLLDAHLMIEHPLGLIEGYANVGCQRVTVHIESRDAIGPCLQKIQDLGMEPGLACFPTTPVPTLDRYLDRVAVVNPLSVDPRHSTGFYEGTPRRIAWLRQRRAQRGLNFVIQGDGGVYEKTWPALVKAGAEELVGGYPIFSQGRPGYAGAVAAMRGQSGSL